jgi:phage-related protein
VTASLTSYLIGEKNKLHGLNRWCVLLDCPIDSITGTLRVVDGPTQFTWNGNIYYPASISVGEVRDSSDGSLNNMSLSVANVARQLQDLIYLKKLADKTIRIMIVPELAPDNIPAVEWEFQIVSHTASALEVAFTLGHVNLFNKPFPKNRIWRSRCGWIYKDPTTCRYAGTLPTCDRTYDGDNGCVAHGADEVANALTQLHPMLFGGFIATPDDR